MLRRFQPTSDGWLPTSHPRSVDPNSTAVPGMPTVTDLPRLGAMGIVSMSCIIEPGRTSHWRRIRPIRAPYSRRMPAASSRSLKSAACITGMNAARLEQRSANLTARRPFVQDIPDGVRTLTVGCCMPQVTLSVVHPLTLNMGGRQRSNNMRAAHHRSERARPGFPRGTDARGGRDCTRAR